MRTANDTLVLLDPVLLADLHRSGWRGEVEKRLTYQLAVADPVRLDHCPSALRQDLDAALRLDSVRRVALSDVMVLDQVRGVQRFFSYEERVMLALACSEGYSVACEGTVFLREATKLLSSGRVLSRVQLIGLAGLIFEHERERPLPTAFTGRTDLARLWQVWDDAGEAATREAYARLKAQGIGVVAKREGVVIEEQADGTIRPLYAKRRN